MHERWLIVAMTLLSPCQFPEHPYGNLLEKLVLFRHASNNSLVPLQEKENIKDGEIIEIVLSGTVWPPEVLVDAFSDSGRQICMHLQSECRNALTAGLCSCKWACAWRNVEGISAVAMKDYTLMTALVPISVRQHLERALPCPFVGSSMITLDPGGRV